jgi:hypothetical protein
MQKMSKVEIDADYRLHELLSLDEVKEEASIRSADALRRHGNAFDIPFPFWIKLVKGTEETRLSERIEQHGYSYGRKHHEP